MVPDDATKVDEASETGRWVGKRMQRVEDRYLLAGRGMFVDDIDIAGTLHLAFVRSNWAAASIEGVDVTDALLVPGVVAVLTAADIADVKALRGYLDRPEFTVTDMPILASDVVRHVGEPIAAVLADSPYAAEDGAEAVDVTYGVLDAVANFDAALATGAASVHAEAANNVLVDISLDTSPDLDGVFEQAAHVVDVAVSTGRLAAAPLEGRACLSVYDDRTQQIVLYSSTQVPHTVRTAVAASLGLGESGVRVISPDVGGGFGVKCVVAREEVLVAAASRLLRRPVKWIEDRREGLTSGFQSREQRYSLSGAFDDEGSLLALRANILCDVGAYSCFPYSCGVEVLMAANELPGAYRVPMYRVRSRGVATNKPPIAPYRGVSRPQAVLAMERLMERAAGVVGIGPVEIRDRNLVARSEFPYRNVNGAVYDAGSYRESLARCAELVEYDSWPTKQADARSDGRLLGLGISSFCEPTAYGTDAFGARKMSIVPGYEQATIRMDPNGSVVMMVGTHSHGQGHATTYAQIVADRLGIDPSRISIRQGDTDLVPHGWGTFASRSVVAGGGALDSAANTLAEKLRQIAAHLLEAAPQDLVLADGRAYVKGSPSRSIAVEELARVAHHASNRLPKDLGRGLEATESFDPQGTYSNATHAAIVEIDPKTGGVTILRYVVVEDCGVMINPMIVDGQVTGGVAQGIGGALLEELVYSPEGQPLAGSFVDYLLPTATDLPIVEVHHFSTPTDRTPMGAKGMGEGGTIGAPAAVLNAVNNALVHLGVQLDRVPIRPSDVIAVMELASADRGVVP